MNQSTKNILLQSFSFTFYKHHVHANWSAAVQPHSHQAVLTPVNHTLHYICPMRIPVYYSIKTIRLMLRLTGLVSQKTEKKHLQLNTHCIFFTLFIYFLLQKLPGLALNSVNYKVPCVNYSIMLQGMWGLQLMNSGKNCNKDNSEYVK